MRSKSAPHPNAAADGDKPVQMQSQGNKYIKRRYLSWLRTHLQKKQTAAMLLAVKKVKELEAQKKALEEQIKENTSLIKELMESKQMEEVQCGEFTVRWAAMAASRFDTTTFKKEHEELYMQYLKPSTSKRFSIK